VLAVSAQNLPHELPVFHPVVAPRHKLGEHF
jgi:hypothetical protein